MAMLLGMIALLWLVQTLLRGARLVRRITHSPASKKARRTGGGGGYANPYDQALYPRLPWNEGRFNGGLDALYEESIRAWEQSEDLDPLLADLYY